MSQATDIVTFGCRLNNFESEVMRSHIQAAGLEDVVIINTCAVTGEAERQARQTIRKIRRERPSSTIIVTGCAAQLRPDRYAEMEEVDYVIGNEAKVKAETYAALNDKRIHITDISLARDIAPQLVQGFEGLTRAFVQVQNGCNHRCTFCVIPFARGPSRSVAQDVVIEQVRKLVESGYPEIALTGVDITAYGADLSDKPTLGHLMRRLLKEVPTLRRLRLSSMDPADVDEELWSLIADEPRLMPYLHISLQAGDDLVLKRMARRHSRDDIIRFCERARSLRPDVVFGADIIAGFPTETDEMFENTLSLVRDLDLTWLHVFPFSSRSGTPASRMPQVKGSLRKERAARLREVGEKAVERHLDSLVGRELEIHVEQPLIGRTPTFAEVSLVKPEETGSVVKVKCLKRVGHKIVAERVR